MSPYSLLVDPWTRLETAESILLSHLACTEQWSSNYVVQMGPWKKRKPNTKFVIGDFSWLMEGGPPSLTCHLWRLAWGKCEGVCVVKSALRWTHHKGPCRHYWKKRQETLTVAQSFSELCIWTRTQPREHWHSWYRLLTSREETHEELLMGQNEIAGGLKALRWKTRRVVTPCPQSVSGHISSWRVLEIDTAFETFK